MPASLSGRVGGRILGVRCNYRYEKDIFFATTGDMVTLTPLVSSSSTGSSWLPVSQVGQHLKDGMNVILGQKSTAAGGEKFRSGTIAGRITEEEHTGTVNLLAFSPGCRRGGAQATCWASCWRLPDLLEVARRAGRALDRQLAGLLPWLSARRSTGVVLGGRLEVARPPGGCPTSWRLPDVLGERWTCWATWAAARSTWARARRPGRGCPGARARARKTWASSGTARGGGLHLGELICRARRWGRPGEAVDLGELGDGPGRRAAPGRVDLQGQEVGAARGGDGPGRVDPKGQEVGAACTWARSRMAGEAACTWAS